MNRRITMADINEIKKLLASKEKENAQFLKEISDYGRKRVCIIIKNKRDIHVLKSHLDREVSIAEILEEYHQKDPVVQYLRENPKKDPIVEYHPEYKSDPILMKELDGLCIPGALKLLAERNNGRLILQDTCIAFIRAGRYTSMKKAIASLGSMLSKNPSFQRYGAHGQGYILKAYTKPSRTVRRIINE